MTSGQNTTPETERDPKGQDKAPQSEPNDDRIGLVELGKARRAAALRRPQAEIAKHLTQAVKLGINDERAAEAVEGVADTHRGSDDDRGQPLAAMPAGQVLSPAQRLERARALIAAQERVAAAAGGVVARGSKNR